MPLELAARYDYEGQPGRFAELLNVMLSGWTLSGRAKSILVICFGAMIPVAVIVQLALGYVIVPMRNSPRPCLPLIEGWPWLIFEVLLGCGLVWKGNRGVMTDSWPPL